MPTDWTDEAQICRNGHLINPSAKSAPKQSQPFCSKCGAPIISECPTCHRKIPGHHQLYLAFNRSFDIPNFCGQCGSAYPWAIAKIDAVKELAALQLSEAEALVLTENLPDLIAETPRTEVAAHKVKKMLTTVGQVVGLGIYKMIIDVCSETAAKILKGP